MSFLDVEDLSVSAGGTQILRGLTLTVARGEVHAIMGPNGSGKSTFAGVLAGRPGFEVTSGDVRLDGVSILDLAPEERARAGVFLAFQYPTEIPGVSNLEFLKTAVDSIRSANGAAEPENAAAFMRRARETASLLDLAPDFLKRGVNEGFSGGEKKRNEILQMLMLEPQLAVLDETDSGLDIDALQVAAQGINHFRSADNAVVLVTHYQRLLDHVVPDVVHVLADGRIARTGDASLAKELERKGYAWLK